MSGSTPPLKDGVAEGGFWRSPFAVPFSLGKMVAWGIVPAPLP